MNPRHLAKLGALLVAYFGAAKLGLSLEAVGGFAAPVWPSSGLALGIALLLGHGLWPAVAVGALLVNLEAGAPLWVAAGIAAGNTAELLLALLFLGRLGFSNDLRRVRDVLILVVFAGLLATTASATAGVASLRLGGVIDAAATAHTWMAWWVGDVLGNLVVAPLFLVWARVSRPQATGRRMLEMVALALLLWVAATAVFGSPGPQRFPQAYMIFPPLLWAALRFGQRGAVTALAGTSALAVFHTTTGTGPFSGTPMSEALLQLQLFVGVAAVTIMVVAAVSVERDLAEAELRRSQGALEARVRERTRQLELSNVALATEVAERRRTEAVLRKREGELAQIGQDLEARVAARTSELASSLREKETLLREIHHRVKNNLQIICSLINLQVRRVEDSQAAAGLRDCRDRVRIMASIHENLYASRDLGHVDFAGYLEDLARNLMDLGHGAADRVDWTVQAEPIHLGLDQAIPAGLMVHELVSNCLKYAFPADRRGRIAIDLRRQDSSGLILRVADDGIGLPAGLDFRKTETLGLQLVCALTEQLGGRIELRDEPGTAFEVAFVPVPVAAGDAAG